MTQVVADSGPLWLQYLVGFGTAGAAIFAGWAAWTARAATKATRKLVELESARDARALEEGLWRHARRVTVDLVGRTSDLADGRVANDVHVRVLNDFPDPMRKPRMGVVVDGDKLWGPQLLGTIPPWSHVALTTRIYGGPGTDVNAFVRFSDVQGNYWLVNARGPVERDERPTSEWIESGRVWEARRLAAEERGTVTGTVMESMPDFDEWLADIAARAESWQPRDRGE